MSRVKTKKKAAARISKKAEERIVELSLQNPDFGARRLVSVLKQEKIKASSSQVYDVLKRNGLQNRDARLKKLEDQRIKSGKDRPTPPAEISPEDEERIVEISLENPDFGARRLVPLLHESGIDVTTSRVYRILKDRGLQSRKLRLAKLEQLRGKEKTPALETSRLAITPAIEERVVEVSLQNPDYGARRLAGLLARESISLSSSAIYALLSRHGLQTRDLRYSRIELEQLSDETAPDEEEAAVPYAVPMAAAPEEQEPAMEQAVETPEQPPPGPLPPAVARAPRRGRWLFYLADVCLLALLVYLGYFGYHAVLNFRQAWRQPVAVAAVKPEPANRTVESNTTVEPLTGYRTIWERNLFNISEKKEAEAKAEIPIEKIALAQKDIGLKLMGTVVANDAALSRAIVHVTKTREQDAFREGDQAGKAKIKKILRNKVIITTDKGDQLLTIDDEDFGRGGRAASNRPPAPMSSPSTQREPGNRTVGDRPRSFQIRQADIEKSLADLEGFTKQIRITPFVQDGQAAGFRIRRIPSLSILRKMGLRGGDVVTGLDDLTITGPEQMTEFFEKIAAGGDFTIHILRRRRTQQLPISIQ